MYKEIRDLADCLAMEANHKRLEKDEALNRLRFFNSEYFNQECSLSENLQDYLEASTIRDQYIDTDKIIEFQSRLAMSNLDNKIILPKLEKLKRTRHNTFDEVDPDVADLILDYLSVKERVDYENYEFKIKSGVLISAVTSICSKVKEMYANRIGFSERLKLYGEALKTLEEKKGLYYFDDE